MKLKNVECAALCDIDENVLNKRAAEFEKMTGKKPALFTDFRKVLEKKEIEGINFQPIKKAKAFIKQRLIDKGLKSEYNPTMCIFILKNNHDMKDKQDIDANVDVKNIKGITFNE